MPPDESLYPADWVAVAEKDLNRLARALGDDDPELAGFCLQQAVEKFLKAFLLSKGWDLRRIHTLAVLLDDAILYEPTFERYRLTCQQITSFYMLDRYPTTAKAGTTEQVIHDSLRNIQGLIDYIRAALPK